jgi:hypothetical protein
LSSNSETGNLSDEDYVEPSYVKRKRIFEETKKQIENKKQKQIEGKYNATRSPHMPSLAAACDRTGVSDRTAAMITSAVLHDIGEITEEDPSKVIDRSKFRRERIRNRNLLQELPMIDSLSSVYFNGRKDMTLVQEQKEAKFYRKTVQEEHITILQEPSSKYIGHIAAESGSAKSIATGILDYLQTNNLDTSNLVAIGCDGTAVNTGCKGGVIRLIELKVNKPLHWFVCQLHGNELPLRHLIEKLDGKTSGPRGFTGVIGQQLDNCETLQPVAFEKIEVDEIAIVCDDLSTDQKYIFEVHQAISHGTCSQDLARRNPGKMSHSRWLTTANRILRLYIGTENPTENLKTIVNYIVKVYVPMWFTIKQNSSATNGAKTLHKSLQLSRGFSADVKKIIDPIINRNGYFGHPENILLTMIDDERPNIRELAWRRIKKCRK